MRILITQNTEIGETELNKVGDKSKDKKDLILQNNIINTRWNQITDMIQVFEPLF